MDSTTNPAPRHASAGMESDNTADRIGAIVERFIAEGKAPGCVVKILQHGKTVFEKALGERDIATHAPMELDTRFVLASMAKPFTSVAIMQLIEKGGLKLDDPVAKILPPIGKMVVHQGDGSPAGERITIQQLLTHTSGLAYGAIKIPGSGKIVSDLYFDAGILYHRLIRAEPEVISHTLEEMVDRLAEMPLAFEPGTAWEYGVASDVLARVVEVLSGERFDRYLQSHIFEPLGMSQTNYFHPDRTKLATNYDIDSDGKFVANDAVERYITEPTFLGGGGELISTAGDYARFNQMLLQGGKLDGVQILRPESVERMTRNYLSDEQQRAELNELTCGAIPNYGFGYAVAVAVEADESNGVAAGDYFWNGGGGTVNWVDPQNGVVGVIMKHVRFDMTVDIAHDIRKVLQGR